MSERIKLTGLWKNKDKNGNTYLSGKLTYSTQLMIFPNTYKKEGEKVPDYYAYVTEQEETKAQAPQQRDSGL